MTAAPRTGALTVALALVLALGAGPAAASRVTLVYEEPIPGLEPEPAYALSVTAAPGEQNDFDVSADARGYTVRDSGVALTAGPGCSAGAAEEVVCAATKQATQYSVFIDAGDEADRIVLGRLGPAMTEVRGGSGADAIEGGPSDDLLFGEGGGDAIRGGPGNDKLDGGSGDDDLDGGEGRDQVSYETRKQSLRLDLAAGTVATGSERDRLTAIEDAVGGHAADVISGDGGPNLLIGGEAGARDRLRGRGGDDIVIGHNVSGGRGNDGLDGVRVKCGAGGDVVYRLQYKTRGPFGRDCEGLLSVLTAIQLPPRSRSGRVLEFTLACRFERCAGKLALSDGRGSLGTASYSLHPSKRGATKRVRVKLGRRPAGRVVRVDGSGPRAYQRDWFRIRLQK